MYPTLLLKGGKPGAPGLAQRQITDKRGRKMTQWVRVEQRARHYTQAQQEFDYDALPTRPDTRPTQKQLGRDALASLERRVRQLRDQGGSTATLLGANLVADFKATGYSRLVGQEIRTPEDLAILAQVYRDPRFETFRVLYTRGDSVVGEAAYSSRLPGVVTFPPHIHDQALADKQRFGADGYYLLHNHPGGKALPSDADRRATAAFHVKVPGLRAHVVVDHNEYGVIKVFAAPDGYAAGNVIVKHTVVSAPQLNNQDLNNQRGVPHGLIGTTLHNYEDVAMAATVLQVNGELQCPVLVLTKGHEAKVSLICQAPFPALQEQQARHGRLPAIIRSLGRMTGAGAHRFLVVTNADMAAHGNQLQDILKAGWVTDVVSPTGRSLLMSIHASEQAQDLFEPKQNGRRVV